MWETAEYSPEDIENAPHRVEAEVTLPGREPEQATCTLIGRHLVIQGKQTFMIPLSCIRDFDIQSQPMTEGDVITQGIGGVFSPQTQVNEDFNPADTLVFTYIDRQGWEEDIYLDMNRAIFNTQRL